MKDRKELLAAQFAACTNQPNWFVPFEQAVRGLNAEQAVWNDVQGANSIWSIVYHLTFWNERYLSRFTGNPPADQVENNDITFQISDVDVTEENWTAAVKSLMSNLLKWQDVILQADNTKLDSPVIEGKEGDWWETIANIAIHNAYHIGQIVDIRKRQGSWENL
ncbi:MAG TPA: DinB family protein [Bacillus sp. (in: firmicutes)]|uniref:DinB family protein n=1 Tax=Bacillus litorisediminis TaxID=2922713 RepID=UPI001FAFECAB|nr:DinB family protein [Bacillus litorisediminis]HWO75286.1 DinB family protein [Bacillus sp. (in: firmicutes)]